MTKLELEMLAALKTVKDLALSGRPSRDAILKATQDAIWNAERAKQDELDSMTSTDMKGVR
jgi:hypothetical protein